MSLDEKQLRQLAGRVAFREEGDYVNAYFAAADTMDGALLVSSMRRALLQEDPALWEAWRELMRDVFAAFFKRRGMTVGGPWREFRAPEHEKTGNA
jgi:hypothetical protein